MFHLKCQTLGIVECKDAVPALQELTIKWGDRPKYSVVIAKIAVYGGTVANRGQCKCVGLWNSEKALWSPGLRAVFCRRSRRLISQWGEKQALPAEGEAKAKAQKQHVELKKPQDVCCHVSAGSIETMASF